MIMYIENSMGSPSHHTHTQLELRKEFSKATGYKINVKKKPVVFPYTGNK